VCDKKLTGVTPSDEPINDDRRQKMHVYMILQAIGDYQGPPIGFYHDRRHALACLELLAKNEAPLIEAGHRVAYLMHYFIQQSGQMDLIEQVAVA
jgi:hypothetical protein